MRTVHKKKLNKQPTQTMRITRDECRLFSILLKDMSSDEVYNTSAFRISGYTKDDYFNAIERMIKKFEAASKDSRRNSERVTSDDFSDLMARLTYKYK